MKNIEFNFRNYGRYAIEIIPFCRFVKYTNLDFKYYFEIGWLSWAFNITWWNE